MDQQKHAKTNENDLETKTQQSGNKNKKSGNKNKKIRKTIGK